MADTKDASWRRENFGRKLHNALRVFENKIHSKISGAEYEGIRLSHLQLLRHIDLDGSPVSEIAVRSGYTKQAASQQVLDACKRGLLTIEGSPQDRRVKIVSFTPSGLSLIEQSQKIVEEIEREFSARVSPEDYAVATEVLEKIADMSV